MNNYKERNLKKKKVTGRQYVTLFQRFLSGTSFYYQTSFESSSGFRGEKKSLQYLFVKDNKGIKLTRMRENKLKPHMLLV